MSLLLRIASAIDALSGAAGKLAVALLLALVTLVGWNVFGRYVVGSSSIALQELEWHLLAPIALLGMPLLMRDGGHVRVDMLFDLLSPRAQQALDLVSMLVGVVISLLFIKYSAGFVDSSWSIWEGSPDPGGLPARYVVKAMIPVGFALLALQCAANAIRHAAALSGREAQP